MKVYLISFKKDLLTNDLAWVFFGAAIDKCILIMYFIISTRPFQVAGQNIYHLSSVSSSNCSLLSLPSIICSHVTVNHQTHPARTDNKIYIMFILYIHNPTTDSRNRQIFIQVDSKSTLHCLQTDQRNI